MSARIWILGAADPEMEAIESLLTQCGERVAYAADARGERVRPADMYRAETIITSYGTHPDTGGVTRVYLVECELLTPDIPREPGEDICHPELAGRDVVRIDHHRPGDPGYGRPPAEFLSASSIGQVIAELVRLGGDIPWDTDREPGTPSLPGSFFPWCGHGSLNELWVSGTHLAYHVPYELVLTAAADHCLGAAYRGECPRVDPDALMRWRAASRAAFQGRPVEEVLADIVAAQELLLAAPRIDLCGTGDGSADPPRVADMRLPHPVPELPEAATRLGIGYMAGPFASPDGRQKYTVSGTPEEVRAWLEHWAPANGIVDTYGDPQRGFAGGYAAGEVAE